jgi:hypothetical protein
MTEFPKLALIEQTFSRPVVNAVEPLLLAPFESGLIPRGKLQDKKICLAVGSRGITNIHSMVKTIVTALQDYGAHPFILPAMGSHGGATESGQRSLLAGYGITEDAMGVPIVTDLETLKLGETPEGFPVYTSKVAFESNGTILINRVKPHTDFTGDIESGLMKMITVGLGKVQGADALHGRIHRHRHDQIILPIARAVLDQGNLLGGYTVVENAYHETARVEFVPPPHFEEREKELLAEARALMPSLPVTQADVLIVDRIGKNISGPGMDPNITGRRFGINSLWQEKNPDITRILVRDISDETEGNAVGVGLADFCHRRIIDKMDRTITYFNAIISRNPINAAIPPYFDCDRELLENTFISLGEGLLPRDVRLIRIPDTLNITQILVSQSILPELANHPQISKIHDLKMIEFDDNGDFIT